MKLSVGFIAALASSVLASPAPLVTPAPRAESGYCAEYATTTSYHYHPCPLFCVEPDSPLCPKLFCPLIPVTCPPGESLTAAPLPPPTTVVGTTTEGCTVTVEADVGCATCGCVGCPHCGPVETAV